MADIQITGKQIKDLSAKSTLEDNDMFVIQDASSTQKINASVLKTYATPDLSNYATQADLDTKADIAGCEFTGNIATTGLNITSGNQGSQGAMFIIQSSSRDVQFRTLNAGIDSFTFNVQNSTPLKLTEAGIMENGILLEAKYATQQDLTDAISQLATKTELNTKVSGTGVNSIQVVEELPDPQVDGVLYIVTGKEA